MPFGAGADDRAADYGGEAGDEGAVTDVHTEEAGVGKAVDFGV